MIYLETERLILRDYEEKEEDLYYRLKSDDKTMYYLQDIKLHSAGDAREDFQNMLQDKDSDNRKFYFLHMMLKESRQQVGSIGYTATDQTPLGKLVHLGYFTYPAFWGNGYTTEALKKLLEFAFTKNGVYRVTTGCLKENGASEKVMINCGLIKEAEHVDWEWHDGKMKTRLGYRLLKHEWEGIDGTYHTKVADRRCQ